MKKPAPNKDVNGKLLPPNEQMSMPLPKKEYFDPLDQLPYKHRINAIEKRMELAEKITTWRLRKADPDSPQLEPALQNLLLRGYDDLIDAVIFTDKPDPELPHRKINHPQLAAATMSMTHITQSDQLRKNYPSRKTRELVAQDLMGAVITHAVETCEDMNMRLHMPAKMFR